MKMVLGTAPDALRKIAKETGTATNIVEWQKLCCYTLPDSCNKYLGFEDTLLPMPRGALIHLVGCFFFGSHHFNYSRFRVE